MFGNMKLGVKITSALVLLGLLTLIVGAAGYWGVSKIDDIADDMGKSRLVKAVTLAEINEAMTAVKAAERTLLVTGLDRAVAARQTDEIKRAWERADKAWKEYEQTPRTADAQAAWDKQTTTWNAWKKNHQEFMRLYEEYVRSNNNPALFVRLQAQALETNYRSFEEAEKNLNDIIALNQRLSAEQVKIADKTATTGTYILLGTLSCALLFALAMGFVLIRNINEIIRGLLSETDQLITAAIGGKLATRGNVNKVNFEFRGVVEGVNQTLDAVIAPLNVAAEYVDKISKGNIPPKITDAYNGDFNTIKNNLNQCIDTINALIAESTMLAKAAVEGNLQTRGRTENFEGGYREIVSGVNETLNAALKPVAESAECLKAMAGGNLDVYVKGDYKGDHATIKEALNATIDSMNEILGQVSVAVEQVSSGSREIAGSSQSLSQGATESASAVEEISSSMHQMASQTNQNAENATQANRLALVARSNAEKGNLQVARMVQAMGEINQSANNISKITTVRLRIE